MHAQLVRPDRYGDPATAIQDEVIDVPELGPHDALVLVMAAGVNFNNVWAARGVPVDVTKTPGALGRAHRLPHRGLRRLRHRLRGRRRGHERAVGDRVVVHAGQWDEDDPWVRAGKDPGLARELPRVGIRHAAGDRSRSSRRCRPTSACPRPTSSRGRRRPPRPSPARTAYRMLFGWPPHTVEPGDVVLVWGGSGGLGSLAIQLVANAGGRPVAVVGSDEKGEYAKSARCRGLHQPEGLHHWGVPPAWDSAEWKDWFAGAKDFGKAIWDVLGEKVSPRIVFEHPGQDTIPTSIFVADRGGMVVICAGTSGYDTMVDVRYLWYMQKRYQGSHLFNDEQAAAFNELVIDGKVTTTLGRPTPTTRPAGASADGRGRTAGGQRQRPGERAARRASPTCRSRGVGLSLLDQLHQHAVHRRRVHERDRGAARSGARRLVDQAHALVRGGARARPRCRPRGTRGDASRGRGRRGSGPRACRAERPEQLDERGPRRRTAPPRRLGRRRVPGASAPRPASAGSARPRRRGRRRRSRRDRCR